MAPNRKRTQAFTIRKDKKIKDLVKRNAATSLLKLPVEVRCRIWGYVVGHQTIHVCHGSSGLRLSHGICEATLSEQDGHDLFQSEAYERTARNRTEEEDMRSSHNRHASCYHNYMNGLIKKLDVNLLQTCRQIYIEANPILWSTTTWSFFDSHILASFMRGQEGISVGISAVQRRLLKKIHLELRYNMYNAKEWHLNKHVLANFYPLDVLHLDIRAQDVDFVRGHLHLPHLNKLTVTCQELASGYPRQALEWPERLAKAEEVRKEILAAQVKAEAEMSPSAAAKQAKKVGRKQK